MKVENQNVEFKEILNDRFERSAVAFLNSKTGGTIYLGIADDGNVVGNHN